MKDEALESYISKIRNPQSWFECYKRQKEIGEILFRSMLAKMTSEGVDYTNIFVNVHYHWGIAIENGLKGKLIKANPDVVKYDIKDGNVFIKSICGRAGKTHNLLQLAIDAGIFNRNHKIYQFDSDYEYLKQVLLHFTDMIKWGARYPVPNNMGSVYKLPEKTPPVIVYGFHILDVLEPLFKFFDKEIETIKKEED